MKHPLQQFVAWATAWTYSDFRKAHLKLSLIYIAIMAVVIGVFTALILVQVQRELTTASPHSEVDVLINVEEALSKAEALHPETTVSDFEYEFDDGTFVLNVFFEDGTESRVDLLTGEVYGDVDNDTLSLYELLTDDIEEVILWVALMVFLVSGLGAVIVSRATLEPIAQKMRQHEDFIANTAHELRNPLAAVSASLQSLERVPPDNKAEFTEVLTGIRAEHERLIHLTESILTLSKNSDGSLEGMESLDVKKRITHIVKSLDSFAKEKDITVIADLESVPLTMRREDLDLIVFNLLHNAIKFSREGRKVSIAWTEGKELIVEDHGIGIGENEKEYIFERFYKADTSRTFSEGSGSGLGLSVVKETLEKIGATIDVKSTPAVGTKITIRFLQ